MATTHRIRSNFKLGTLGANLLTTVTTIDFGSDPGFATLDTDEYLVLIIDPEGAGNGPEIVYLTAYTATQTTGTIERGKEGTSDPGVTHPAGTDWIHGATAIDHDRQVWALTVDEPAADATLDLDISGFEAIDIVGWLAPANDSVDLLMRFSNDGGSSFRSGAADYAWGYHGVNINLGTDFIGNDDADTAIKLCAGVGSAAGENASFRIRIVNPAESGAYTVILAQIFRTHSTPYFGGMDCWGAVITAEANDAVRFLFSGGNIADGRVTVYGYPAAA